MQNRDPIELRVERNSSNLYETMEQLRLLSNNEVSDNRRLHFVFVGQPELVGRLTSPALRQLDQRIGARAVLNPLQRTEVQEYVEQRLQAVGGTTKSVFKPGAMRCLVRQPRHPAAYQRAATAPWVESQKWEISIQMLAVRSSFLQHDRGSDIVTVMIPFLHHALKGQHELYHSREPGAF